MPAVQSLSALNLTVPTRTPTPLPTDLPPTDSPQNPTPGNNPSPATNTPPPTATATALPPTPAGGYLPTAVPCSDQPTILALNPNFINARSGPGIDYAVLDQLIYHEVRPIIGQAAEAPWWLILLADGQNAWVADEVVLVHGNTRNVPVVAAPALNGATLTPAAPWQPTPPPACATATPTTSPTTSNPAEPTATALINNQTGVQIVTPIESLEETTADTGQASEAYPAADAEQSTQTNVMSGSAVTPTPSATAITLADNTAVEAPATQPPPTAPESRPTADGQTGFDAGLLLLAGGGLLLLLSAGTFLIKKRS